MTTLETRYGKLNVPDIQHDLIGRFLARYGEWANDEVRFVASALPSDRPLRVLDVGAFVGTFGIGLSQVANVQSTTFVEANPAVAPLLADNAERNVRGKSEVIEAAVTPKGCFLSASYEGQNLGSLSFASPTATIRVPSRGPARFAQLADLISEAGGADLVKMDVEGLEHAILDSERSLLAPGGPAFWLECNDGPNSLALLDLLVDCGLQVHFFAFPSFVPDNFLGSTEPIFPWAYESGLWASRGPAPVLSPILVEHQCILKSVRTREELRLAMWRTPRWASLDWQGLSQAELIAETGHASLGERFNQYLVDPAVASESAVASSVGSVAQVDALRLSEEKASAEVRALRVLLDDAERRLCANEGLLQTNSDLKALASDSIRQVQLAEAHSAKCELNLLQIQQSLYWRISGPLRRFLARHDQLRGMLRASASRIFRLVKRSA